MTFLRAVWTLLHLRDFRRLFVARITSSFSDGVFQVALASHVLFNPEKAADARSIALAFAVVLLPYSVLGPFAGVLLDRWNRRRVLVVSQLIRVVALVGVAALVMSPDTGALFFALVLLVFSVNRFILAGLASAMPHVVTRDRLVSANSVAPTCGSIAYLLGGAVGTGMRAVGASDLVVVLAAALGVLAAAWTASRLPFIGPDDTSEAPALGQLAGSVLSGIVEAVVTGPRRARLLLVLVFLTRLPFGFFLLQSLLLFRGPFEHGHGALNFGIAAVGAAAGFTLAAFVTPWLAPRLGAVPYAARMLAIGAFVCAVLGPLLAAVGDRRHRLRRLVHVAVRQDHRRLAHAGARARPPARPGLLGLRRRLQRRHGRGGRSRCRPAADLGARVVADPRLRRHLRGDGDLPPPPVGAGRPARRRAATRLTACCPRSPPSAT